MTDVTYITAPEQAKLIRQALKTAFGKAIKFSVTCSRGSAIRVSWVDGPTKTEVESIAGKFRGGYSDGMQDMTVSHDSILNGKTVRFSADYIFCNRDISDAFKTKTAATLATLDGKTYCDLLNKAPRFHGEDLNDFNQQAGNICHILSLCTPNAVDNLPIILSSN